MRRVMARLLRQRYPDTPTVSDGREHGRRGADGPGDRAATRRTVDGYVLIAPAVWGRAEMNPFLRGVLWLAAHHTVPGMLLENRGYVKITASDNHAALVRLSNDPLTIHEDPGGCDQGPGGPDGRSAGVGAEVSCAGAVSVRRQGRSGPETGDPGDLAGVAGGGARDAGVLPGRTITWRCAIKDRETVIDDVLAWMKRSGGAAAVGRGYGGGGVAEGGEVRRENI